MALSICGSTLHLTLHYLKALGVLSFPLCSSNFFSFPKAELALCLLCQFLCSCRSFLCLLLISGLSEAAWSLMSSTMTPGVLHCFPFLAFAVVGIESRPTTLPLNSSLVLGVPTAYVIFPVIFESCLNIKASVFNAVELGKQLTSLLRCLIYIHCMLPGILSLFTFSL